MRRTSAACASVLYAQMGKLRLALDDQRALAADESVFEGPASLAEHLSNAGIVYARLGDLEMATAALKRSLETAESAKDETAAAAAYGNRGLVHRMEGDWAASIEAYRKALALFEAGGWDLNISISRLAIADAYLHEARASLRGLPAADEAQRTKLREAARARCQEAVALLEKALQTIHAKSIAAAGSNLAAILNDTSVRCWDIWDRSTELVTIEETDQQAKEIRGAKQIAFGGDDLIAVENDGDAFGVTFHRLPGLTILDETGAVHLIQKGGKSEIIAQDVATITASHCYTIAVKGERVDPIVGAEHSSPEHDRGRQDQAARHWRSLHHRPNDRR